MAARYLVILTAPQEREQDGETVTLPAGTIVNVILVEPGAEYAPPPGTRLEPAEGEA